MPFLTVIKDLGFYHHSLLTFLIGAQIYQSFFANIASQQALNRAGFRTLQAAIWPMYFKLQLITSILLALTFSNTIKTGHLKTTPSSGSASLAGVFEPQNRQTVMAPLLMMTLFAASNVFYWTPKATSVMFKIQVVSAREEKAGGAAGNNQQESKALTRKFLILHAFSYGSNMAVLITSIWYAVKTHYG